MTPRVLRLTDDRWTGRSCPTAFDLIHAEGPAAVRQGAVLAVRAGARFVASGADAPGGGVLGWLTRRALRRADRVVAATRAEAARYMALGVPAERIRVWTPPPPAPAPPPPHLHRDLDLPETARLIVAVGRFDRAADLQSAVWAFDILRYVLPDVYLVLVGEGPQRDRVERFARTAAFDDYRVRFTNPRDDWPALISAADVVWSTHRRGGIAPVLVGMAAGKPVVGFHTPDLSEFVTDGDTGRLVPPGDRVRLAAVTLELLRTPDAGLGERARAHVGRAVPPFSADEQFAALYAGLISSGG